MVPLLEYLQLEFFSELNLRLDPHSDDGSEADILNVSPGGHWPANAVYQKKKSLTTGVGLDSHSGDSSEADIVGMDV